jgi:hypothetical protein
MSPYILNESGSIADKMQESSTNRSAALIAGLV